MRIVEPRADAATRPSMQGRGAVAALPRRGKPGTAPSGTVTRDAFWMETSRGARATWLHLPAAGRMRPAGVVICSPVGHEYTHSYRAQLHLAERLAEVGLPTLRFDYHACGSSTGHPLDDDLVETWIDDARTAATLIERLTGSPASLVGLRLGAALGATVAARIELDHFVGWAPVTSGRRYVRELNALTAAGALAGAARRAHDGFIEPGGFMVSDRTLAELGSLDLGELYYRIRGDALVLEPDDAPRQGPVSLADILRSQGVATDVLATTGYTGMMAKPHYSVVPEATLESIVGWLERRTRSTRPRQGVRGLPRRTATTEVTDGAVEEMVHVPGDPPLFGVLTTPRADWGGGRPLLLLTNAGSAHTAGPNRLYVDIARTLAAAGIASLRLDLANLGDSIRGRDPCENHPYPCTAQRDVGRAIAWLAETRGVHRVVLGGLCSGAYVAFVCGQDSSLRGLEGLLMINPLTFAWRDGDPIDVPQDARHHTSVRDPKRWRKFLNGAYSPGKIARFVLGAALERGRDAVANALERMGLISPRSVGRGLLTIAGTGRRMDFVFSRYDPGFDLLMARAANSVARLQRHGSLSIATVEGADHSFSQADRRRDLVRHVTACLIRYPTLAANGLITHSADPARGTTHAACR